MSLNPMLEYENNRIIVIDDDARIHEDFRKILDAGHQQTELDEMAEVLFESEESETVKKGYELESAYQGKEGFEKIVEANRIGRPYAMAFVDMRMPPGWDGLETIKHIWAEDKNIQLVICTAYSDYSWSEMLYHLGASDRLIILKKPFDMVEVQQMATALTTKWRLACESLSRLKRIEESEEKFRTVVDSVNDTIITLDVNGEIKFVNHNPWNLYDKMAGHNYFKLISEADREKVENAVKSVIENGAHKSIEFCEKGKDEKLVWAEGRVSPYYKDDKVVAATLVTSDISARKALDWQLRHDELTGLANRAYFTAQLQNVLDIRSEFKHVAVMFIDIDHFNLINDCFGHEMGDKLLVEMARLIKSEVFVKNKKDISSKPFEMLARLGGDEFAVLKCFNEDALSLKLLANRLNEVLKQPVEIEGFEVYPSVSIGVVLSESTEDSVSDLMRDADAALYHAKSSGRNRFEFFDQGLRDNIVRRVNMGAELRRAIENREFIMRYQPIVSIARLEVAHFEALIRWQHPEKGEVLPLDFIPMAEETGLIIPITRQVIEMVSEQIKEWQDLGYDTLRVAVNCSAKEFNEQKLQSMIADVCEQTQIDAAKLELELTESSIMENVDKAIDNMRSLSEMGVSISIDDFGTGYSSFSYIKQFKINKIKIDRSFIVDTPEDRDDRAIVEAIIAMARRLKIEVVAEGVETPQQAQFLKSAGCDYIQGFLLARPMTAEKASQHLAARDWDLAALEDNHKI